LAAKAGGKPFEGRLDLENGGFKMKNVAILFGGCSPEYSVSLESAYAVASHIDREKFNPILIGITQNGAWFNYTGALQKIQTDTWNVPGDCVPVVVSPNRGDRELLVLRNSGIERIRVDVALPVLHGANGEDGKVQGLIELAGIPLAGCGVLSSALCMDKDRAHKLSQAAGVAVPASYVLRKGMDRSEVPARAEELGYPLFVKPVRAGSSCGITRVTAGEQLPAAIQLALSYDDEVILEEAIPGFEVGCAVMGKEELVVGEVDEIELSDGFFDYEEKYTLKTSAIHVPARISAETAERIKETAKVIYRALDCRGFARVDMFLEPGGRIVFNEVNTIPGFTAHSRYPSMMKAAGLSLGEIISAVLELAVRE